MTTEARILLYDLEVTPILGWVYAMWEARVIHVEEPQHIMSFAYKWLGDDKIHVVAQADFKRFNRDKTSDKEVVLALRELLNEADIVVAHNANGFDNKMSLGRILYHGIEPPSPFISVDTLAVARRTFKLGANTLQYLCEQLGIGTKSEVRHHDVWRRCINGELDAWDLLRAYNINDVVLLEGLYQRLRPFMPTHPVVSREGCPKCGGRRMQRRGIQRSRTGTFARLQCQDCGSWSRQRKSLLPQSELV